ncbi:hypothetical protein CHS0354_028384 [Potamilus streckersoni]|uniref:Uncharacterized protein n=1 Tax=Potamilus streckersoni TaxID=2493646 RepID=A0AAE0RTT0_9BIVA|nr:hypothetical protein CHS0354_028384 [Potamilus streckersoni]
MIINSNNSYSYATDCQVTIAVLIIGIQAQWIRANGVTFLDETGEPRCRQDITGITWDSLHILVVRMVLIKQVSFSNYSPSL